MEKMVDKSDIFQGTYKGKRILVTGHTGFKGSWLCLWLSELGAQIAGFSKYFPSEPCNFNVIGMKDKLSKHYEGDICNFEELKHVFDDFKPQMVFHLAAQPIVRRSYNEPKITFDTNLGGTINVLECIKGSKDVEAAVMITSDKCYENVGWDWGYRETDRLGGEDPYSASKACAEIAISSYCRSYFNTKSGPYVASARAGNVIGGGDWGESRIIPDCVRAWSIKDIAVIRKPEATRPWQHVLEPLSGYLWLGACLLNNQESIVGEAFNFGPNADVIKSVQEIVETFLKYWEKLDWKHIPLQDEKKEAILLKLSCDKALRRLSWHSILTFEQTIKLTAQWYKNFYDKKINSYEYTILQINYYLGEAEKKQAVWIK